MELGLLLTLPLESIAVRAVVASVVGVALSRLLLRAGVRSVTARIATALIPAVALLGTLAWSSRTGGLQPPSLMLPVDAVDALPIPVPDGYVHFAPSAAPLLVGAWATVALVLVIRRARALGRARRAGRAALAAGPPPAELQATVTRLANSARVTVPKVAAPERCPGGAFVTGLRRPVLVVGRDLLARLDAEELEGVVAHELAHVRRRDNLVATAVGVVRDLAFFVPGGRWALRQLHRERERAADHAAVQLTGRPGALASGLLKTLEGPGPAHPCAALAPPATVVDRVTELVDGPPAVSRTRSGVELVVVGSIALIAVGTATLAPTALTGAERERDAVAVAWTSTAAQADVPAESEARAFEVYRATRLEVDQPTATRSRVEPRSGGVEDRPATWRACAEGPQACPSADRGVGLGLVPRPTITLDDRPPWQATPAFSPNQAPEGLRLPAVYWLQRVG